MFGRCLCFSCDGKQQSILTLAVHVFDTFAVESVKRCDRFGRDLNKLIPVKNLGEVRWYSGLHHERGWEKGTLSISQQTFAEELAQEYQIENGKIIPMGLGVNLDDFQQDEESTRLPFRELVGSLMWLATQTRPDISNAVKGSSRVLCVPTTDTLACCSEYIRVCEANKLS